MKKILKLILFLALAVSPQMTVYALSPDEIAEDLLTNPQENEVVLTEDDDAIFDAAQGKTKFSISDTIGSLIKNNTDNDEDDAMVDNNELDFEMFKIFDKNNDNIIDEDTLLGKIIHSKITRTDIPSFLLKDNLTFNYEKGLLQKIQLYGGYRGAINGLFSPAYSTTYETLTTEVGMYGSFRNPNYKFKFKVNPVPKEGVNYIDNFIGDAYIMNTSLPHHQIIAGYSRVQTGIEGGTSSFILPFITRSQIARNFGSAKSLSVKILGNYEYMDYNIALGSSGRYTTSGMPGAEFNGWINFKPFGSLDKKYGKLTIGGGFNGGHNRIDYSVGSVYIGYKHKKLWTNVEAAIADGYNGSKGISSNKACGFAATAGWKFTPHLQLIGRIDQFDPNRHASNDLKREYTIGLNWFIKGQALRFVLNYVFCENQNTKDSHKIILATQVML